MHGLLFTSLALFAFAGNSVLCRLALGEGAIDAASFTWLRLLSGIVMLVVILAATTGKVRERSKNRGSWQAAFMLFVYAVSFSYAYNTLDTGMGALILFAAVQMTMIVMTIMSGKALGKIEWGGVILAFSGFVYLMSPGLSAPPLLGFILMTLSGIAWGFYTLAGKSSADPLSDTTYNFVRTLPFILLLAVFSFEQSYFTSAGIWYAVISGAVTSGIGYAIWYVALRNISSIQAAVVQLLVPVIAAFGGVLFANEQVSLRLMIASIGILCGVLTVIMGKQLYARAHKNRRCNK